jgi:transposase
MVDLPHGTVMPPSACWPVPTWSSCVKRRSGPSGSRGRNGAGPTRQSPLAATPRGARSTRASSSSARAAPPLATAEAELTDAAWCLVQSLLPPQKPTTGRPRHDHRTVLAGILWVVRSGASWRAMPTEYGTWETAYQRYRLWCATGLWPRILAALPQAESKVSL